MPSSIASARHAAPVLRRPGAPLRRFAAVLAVMALAAGIVATEAVVAAAAPADCRILPVDADDELRSDLARAEFDVDGTGVKVGIISNSYATAGQAAVDADVAGGLLPGPGNPCGWLTPVTELFASPPADDEGRAMAQLVHGVAPGAQLYFAPADGDGSTPDDDQASFIQALRALHEQGVDIIVDDIALPDEPFFQQSRVSSYIDGLVEDGVLYLSAAGNETVIASAPRADQRATPVNGWRTEAYRAGACADFAESAVKTERQIPDAVVDCMDFDQGPDVDTTALFGVLPDQLPNNGALFVTEAIMQWAEQFGAVTGEFEMVLSVVKTTGTAVIGGATVACTEIAPCYESTVMPSGSPQMPVRGSDEIILAIQPGDVTEIEVSLVRITQRTPASPVIDLYPAIGYLFQNDGPPWIAYAEYAESQGPDTVGRTIIGHNGAASVLSVAATGYQADDQVEKYSSVGPVLHTLTPESDPAPRVLETPEELHAPNIVSVDGVKQTALQTPGYEVEGQPGVYYFYGTSAATPNAGAVAALALQVNPDLTPAQIRTYLTETATPLDSPYPGVIDARDSVGAGLVNAQALLQRVAADLPAPVPGAPAVRVLPATGGGDAAGMLAAGAGLAVIGVVLVAVRRRARA